MLKPSAFLSSAFNSFVNVLVKTLSSNDNDEMLMTVFEDTLTIEKREKIAHHNCNSTGSLTRCRLGMLCRCVSIENKLFCASLLVFFLYFHFSLLLILHSHRFKSIVMCRTYLEFRVISRRNWYLSSLLSKGNQIFFSTRVCVYDNNLCHKIHSGRIIFRGVWINLCTRQSGKFHIRVSKTNQILFHRCEFALIWHCRNFSWVGELSSSLFVGRIMILRCVHADVLHA